MDLKVTRFNFHIENYQTRISFDKQITKLKSKRVKLHPISQSRILWQSSEVDDDCHLDAI